MPDDIARIQSRLTRLETHLGLRPPYPPPIAPFYGLTPASGLHVLKDKWCQVASMEQQCRWLHEELDVAIESTRLMSPHRTQGFRSRRRVEQPRPLNGGERQLNQRQVAERNVLNPQAHEREESRNRIRANEEPEEMLVNKVNQLRNPSDGAVVFIHRETLHGEVLFCDPHTS